MLLLGDCNHWLKEIKDNSIDLITTDPPYGIEFMAKDWDKALVPTETWKECYRVLKEGKLAFVMCSPRQDVLSRMIVNLQDAGFRTNYSSIYHTYASGFPKAANISKLIDKKNGRYFDTSVKDYLNQKRKEKGLSFYDINKYLEAATNGGGIASALMGDKPNNELPTVANYNKLKMLLELDDRFDDLIEREEAEREIIGQSNNKIHLENIGNAGYKEQWNITKPATEEAKKMEGAYVGFQPKPAVEIILVVSKGKTLTWLDDCRIPYQSEDDKAGWYSSEIQGTDFRQYAINHGVRQQGKHESHNDKEQSEKGRFPANLLVSDDVLNDGKITKETTHWITAAANKGGSIYKDTGYKPIRVLSKTDGGEYSRYFSLDAWSSCSRFPFLIVPKASASERNKGCESLEKQKGGIAMRQYFSDTIFVRKNEPDKVDVAVYLHSWRAKAGLSQGQIDELMGWNTMYSWLEGRKSGVSLTSPESWMRLKEILGFDDKFDKQMTELVEVDRGGFSPSLPRHNTHATVKPLKLMSYLITMGSREGDLVLDPFCGSGTVCIAAHQLHRKWLGIEMNPEYAEIIKKRLADPLAQLKLTSYLEDEIPQA